MLFSPASSYFLRLRAKYLLQRPVLQYAQPPFLLNLTDHASHPRPTNNRELYSGVYSYMHTSLTVM